MSKQIEFFFDFGSPTTYLAWTQLPRIAAAHGASIAWRPMLLGGVFKATGNHSPIEVPAKGRYTLHDLARYAKRYGVPLAFNPAFPINTLTLMRGAQLLRRRPVVLRPGSPRFRRRGPRRLTSPSPRRAALARRLAPSERPPPGCGPRVPWFLAIRRARR